MFLVFVGVVQFRNGSTGLIRCPFSLVVLARLAVDFFNRSKLDLDPSRSSGAVAEMVEENMAAARVHGIELTTLNSSGTVKRRRLCLMKLS